ncbi:tetratricopeptide repeat protein [Mucilaginibacter ginkgonis]|uniref:Tetratricopeptide repeat protein n=1 Tax=Mucilaginibacter ginkgonis TaxID=2682091 RepID=A0A6I4HX86_9SPHI|nr:tetratricopeptide repeat protein [Mucilaginibacter ginkgonis]QQL51376.1 tetratricopeptide repeat protein [Mucilaginibacter ginkgonis]
MEQTRLEKLLEFIKNEPNDEFLQYAIATEYLKLNDHARALEYYETLVKDHPEYFGTYYHLGKLYELLNRKDEAIATYQKGMEITLASRNSHAYNELQGALRMAQGLEEDDDDY